MSSEVTRIRKQIEDEYIAASNGLNGLAGIARHTFISRRYRRIDELHTELADHVGQDAATKIVYDISERIVK